MKLNSMLTAVALVSGSFTAWADSAFISNLPALSAATPADLSALQSASANGAAPSSAITFNLTNNLSLSHIRITVLDLNPVALDSSNPGHATVLLDHTLTAGNAYFFQVTGSRLTNASDAVTPVPEAGSFALMLSGLALLGLKLRRRRLA